MNYDEFLKSKSFLLESSGFEANEVDEHLYPFQRDIVKWAIRKGRAAIFADCGLGKTIMQVMPDAAKDTGFKFSNVSSSHKSNIEAGVKYLAKMKKDTGGTWEDAVS